MIKKVKTKKEIAESIEKIYKEIIIHLDKNYSYCQGIIHNVQKPLKKEIRQIFINNL